MAERIEFTIEASYSSPEKAKVAIDRMKHVMNMHLAVRVTADPALYFFRVVDDSLWFEQVGSKVTIHFQVPHRELRRVKQILK